MNVLMNARISTKILSTIALISLIVFGGALYSAREMQAIDDTYSDLIAHDSFSTLEMARVNRFISWYSRNVYALAHQETEEGNQQFLAKVMDAQKEVETRLEKAVNTAPPERKAQMTALAESAKQTFALCGTAVKQAASTTNYEEILKVVGEIQKECDPQVEKISAEIRTNLDQFTVQLNKDSDAATDTTHTIIAITLGSISGGLILA
jgi:hypothetical protein